MKILIAPDKFKGSLNAEQVCTAIRKGLLVKYPEAEIISIPLADGGEGTCELLTQFFHGEFINVTVNDPLFEKITASYGYVPQQQIAFIEMARASGLQLILKEKQNPLYTTTYGTGELIKDALNRGAKQIVLGIGGSATNDAGIGMAEALGYLFFNSHQQIIKPIGENLIHLHSIDATNIHPRVKEASFIALCDVTNPLYGSNGAAFIYGAQKGADHKAIELLDKGLQNFERVIRTTFHADADFPGAGAGGGIASGARVFLQAEIKKGIDYIVDMLELEKKIKAADFVITGEGKIDRQTLSGKVVSTIARLALKHHKKVIAICGTCELSEQEMKNMGVYQTLSLTDSFTSHEEAIKNASMLLSERVTQIEI